jgi:hypothetical protein
MPQILSRVPYFGTFLPNHVAIQSIENDVRKSCSDLAPKVLMKLMDLPWFLGQLINQKDYFSNLL